jgi:hypothetical protein
MMISCLFEVNVSQGSCADFSLPICSRYYPRATTLVAIAREVLGKFREISGKFASELKHDHASAIRFLNLTAALPRPAMAKSRCRGSVCSTSEVARRLSAVLLLRCKPE